ncbi:MAG: biotin/lipoyl-binding protein [Cyclobacteriaceae bacterium]
MRKYIFIGFWFVIAASLAVVSLRYKSKTEALIAVVESQVTAISFQQPVVVTSIRVVPGQAVRKGDTLVILDRPDLNLDIEQKINESESVLADIEQSKKNYISKVELLRLERDGKTNRLKAELNELQTKLNQQSIIRSELIKNGKIASSDSLRAIEVAATQLELTDITKYFNKEIERQKVLMENDVALKERELAIIKKELEALYEEKRQLVRISLTDGIVGTVNAQLSELVPPYKTILSLYESNPSVIKAFYNERLEVVVRPGDSVRVVSENRLYSTDGIVKELGARITSYPDKIQSNPQNTMSYGQEIFIEIPKNNSFLNGEKVFVYPNSVYAE